MKVGLNLFNFIVDQGKLPLTGITVTKLEHSDNSFKNAFEIKGNMNSFCAISFLRVRILQPIHIVLSACRFDDRRNHCHLPDERRPTSVDKRYQQADHHSQTVVFEFLELVVVDKNHRNDAQSFAADDSRT